MVDFIKILIKDLDSNILENNPLLDFYDNINLNTGEIKTINRYGKKVTEHKRASYKGLEFKIYSTGIITLAGSLHKYWNSGAHNYNDFSNMAFDEVLNELKSNFAIVPRNCILKCLEIGVNIEPPIPTNSILDYCFLHKTKPFEYTKNSSQAKYKQVQHAHYIIKLYNKALHYNSQFDILSEILRFEIKYTKMEKLNKQGIYNLEDLQNYGLINFKNELINEFNNILYYDKTIQSDSKRIMNYKNPLYWIELLDRPRKSSFYKHKEILRDLTLKYSNQIQKQLSVIMSKKIDLLNDRGASIDSLIIRSNHTPPLINNNIDNTLCKVTNINISMQKDNSIYLSYSGLRYYYKYNKKVFDQMKREYLSKRWLNSDLETQIKEIAHNIRNTSSNQKLKQKRIYQPQQTNMLLNYGLVNN